MHPKGALPQWSSQKSPSLIGHSEITVKIGQGTAWEGAWEGGLGVGRKAPKRRPEG